MGHLTALVTLVLPDHALDAGMLRTLSRCCPKLGHLAVAWLQLLEVEQDLSVQQPAAQPNVAQHTTARQLAGGMTAATGGSRSNGQGGGPSGVSCGGKAGAVGMGHDDQEWACQLRALHSLKLSYAYSLDIGTKVPLLDLGFPPRCTQLLALLTNRFLNAGSMTLAASFSVAPKD